MLNKTLLKKLIRKDVIADTREAGLRKNIWSYDTTKKQQTGVANSGNCPTNLN